MCPKRIFEYILQKTASSWQESMGCMQDKMLLVSQNRVDNIFKNSTNVLTHQQFIKK